MQTPTSRRLILLPLTDEVIFPRTERRLRVKGDDVCQRLEALARAPEASRGDERLGLVLLRPGWAGDDISSPAFYSAGTAARLVSHEPDAEGCEIVVRGAYRFEIEQEIMGESLHQAWVRPLSETLMSEQDPDVIELRRRLIERIERLAGELGERFDLDLEQIRALRHLAPFEQMVNRLATQLDEPPTRKLQLLRATLPDRALHLLTLLHSRQRVLDVLRPYRWTSAAAATN